MMNSLTKIYLLLLLGLFIWNSVYPHETESHSGLFLFADREYCASGDTVWFNVFRKDSLIERSNVIHVQLSAADERIITSVACRSKEEFAEGYVHVPDSLSSGVYFLTAFQQIHKNSGGWQFFSKTLFVYNRFSTELSAMEVPSRGSKLEMEQIVERDIIRPEKKIFNTREAVNVKLNLDNIQGYGMSHIVVKAERMDELASGMGGYYNRTSVASEYQVPGFLENDGMLISGKVIEKESRQAGKRVVVLLSLLNDPQYLDYCISDETGRFNFFLKNAVGTGEVVLQVITEDKKEWDISLVPGNLKFTRPMASDVINLTPGQSGFIKEIIDVSYFTRIFGSSYELKLPGFDMPRRFEFPIYGKPYETVVLAEYYDLPDFLEISRELLHGVRYRRKGNDITIRLLNLDANEHFDSEPLRLINGIPVFSNRMLASMGSEDIEYIDYVLEDRIYGDLRFSGVLAVYLKDNSTGWMSRQSDMRRFSVRFLQPEHTPSYLPPEPKLHNIPDFRQVYYWQRHEADDAGNIEFHLSDLKGKVKISVEGVTAGGLMFNSTEIIEVR